MSSTEVPDMIDSAVAAVPSGLAGWQGQTLQDASLQAINSLLPYYRSSWWPYRVFLPKAMTHKLGRPMACHISAEAHHDLELAQV